MPSRILGGVLMSFVLVLAGVMIERFGFWKVFCVWILSVACTLVFAASFILAVGGEAKLEAREIERREKRERR